MSFAKVTITCQTCDKEFQVLRSRIKQGRGKFCSRECKYKSHKRQPHINGDGTATIPLTKGMATVIDANDLPLLATHSWSVKDANGIPYAVTRIRGKVIPLHHLLIDAPRGMVRDHIDGDSLNNRRSNLRVCTQGDNLKNRRVDRGKQFKGVIHGPRQNFLARINGKHLGTFSTPEDAAAAYDRAAREMYGEFARTNFNHGKAA